MCKSEPEREPELTKERARVSQRAQELENASMHYNEIEKQFYCKTLKYGTFGRGNVL